MGKERVKEIYKRLKRFKKDHPSTISWRLKAHAKVVDKFLSHDEKVLFAFAAQKNERWYDIITTYAVVLTNRRLIVAQKRLLIGYLYTAITPDLFNDIKVKKGIIWGKVYIDTLREFVSLSNVSKRALPEIESKISRFMMEEKKKYRSRPESSKE